MAEMIVKIEGVSPNGGAIPIVGTQTPPFRVSVGAGGNVSAPTAGAAIATITSGNLPAGLYELNITIGMSGTLAAADVSNMELRVGGVVVLPKLTYTSIATSNPVAKFSFQCAPDGTQAISINATGAATASSVYSANIVATQVN